MHLIIQIPCYNEESTLSVTIADLPTTLPGIDCLEYLIINDGSSDNTIEVARSLGVHHIVNFKCNKGLASGFMAGIDACLRLGADIIVNTDADNQYCGEDIAKLVAPIVTGTTDIVIGERPIEDTEQFSLMKKRMQRFGSWVVRVASGTSVPDAPSGFRAFSREAAMRINVINAYTYTLETIIQAGAQKTAMMSVPINTNPETRKSRLFKSMWAYMRRSSIVIIRAFMMYRPLKFFTALGGISSGVGTLFVIRWIVHVLQGHGGGNVQSLILAAMLIMVGVQFVIAGLQADIIAANRKLLEDVQIRVKRMEYESAVTTGGCARANQADV